MEALALLYDDVTVTRVCRGCDDEAAGHSDRRKNAGKYFFHNSPSFDQYTELTT
jgi:hypothetical protein